MHRATETDFIETILMRAKGGQNPTCISFARTKTNSHYAECSRIPIHSTQIHLRLCYGLRPFMPVENCVFLFLLRAVLTKFHLAAEVVCLHSSPFLSFSDHLHSFSFSCFLKSQTITYYTIVFCQMSCASILPSHIISNYYKHFSQRKPIDR